MRDFFGNRLRLRILFQEIIASGTKQGDYNLAVFFWPDCSVNLFGYYAWQLEVGRNPTGDVLRDDSQTWLNFYRRMLVRFLPP